MVQLSHGYKDVLCILKGEKTFRVPKYRRKESRSRTRFHSRRESKVP